jgi:prevent-host-death family protein
MRAISSTELSKNLSDVINRVYYQHETVVVERGGKPVCQIAPVAAARQFSLANLVELLRSIGSTDPAFADAVRAGVEQQDDFAGLEWPASSTRASSSK